MSKKPRQVFDDLKDMEADFSKDGKRIKITFKTSGDDVHLGLDEGGLNLLLGATLDMAKRTGQLVSPEKSEGRQIATVPLEIAGLTIAYGRTDGEMLLSVQLGLATLSFAIPSDTLVSICKAVSERGLPPKPLRPN